MYKFESWDDKNLIFEALEDIKGITNNISLHQFNYVKNKLIIIINGEYVEILLEDETPQTNFISVNINDIYYHLKNIKYQHMYKGLPHDHINTMLFPFRCWAKNLDLEKYILVQRNFKIIDEL